MAALYAAMPQPDTPLVAGADGARGGWVVVLVRAHAAGKLELVETRVVAGFPELVRLTAECSRVAVDVPIGLSQDGLRGADAAARRLIGARRSSVFPPPPRALLEAVGDYAALNALSRRIRAGLSRQTYGILPKMREADASLTPELQRRVFESHPEVSFRALKQAELKGYKLRPEGRRERLALLQGVFGESISSVRPPRGAALDDLYDAAALAWTADRAARGLAQRLPSQPEVDARGLKMEIVY